MRPLTTVLLAFLAVAATGCTYNPATGRSQLLMMSTQEEISLGTEAKPALIERYGGEVDSARLRAYVDEVGQAIAARTEADYTHLPWEFTVLDSEIVNAFALPGGKVFVSRGLLQDLDNEAQMAAVLGHEIGHVTAQHIDERITQALLLELGVAAASGLSESQVVYHGARLFSQGYQLSYSRDQESEADEIAMRYMAAAGYAPAAMIELLKVLAEATNGPRAPEMLSTHPHPETRIHDVYRLLNGPYKHTIGNQSFRLGRNRYQHDAVPYVRSE